MQRARLRGLLFMPMWMFTNLVQKQLFITSLYKPRFRLKIVHKTKTYIHIKELLKNNFSSFPNGSHDDHVPKYIFGKLHSKYYAFFVSFSSKVKKLLNSRQILGGGINILIMKDWRKLGRPTVGKMPTFWLFEKIICTKIIFHEFWSSKKLNLCAFLGAKI